MSAKQSTPTLSVTVFLLAIIFLSGAGWHVWSSLRQMEASIPLVTLTDQRHFSGLIQTLMNLSGKIETAYVQRSRLHMDELMTALDSAYTTYSHFSRSVDVSNDGKLLSATLEMNYIIFRIDEMMAFPDDIDDTDLLTILSRLKYIIAIYRNYFLQINETVLSSMAQQVNDINILRYVAIVTILMVMASIIAIGFQVWQQRKIISALAKTRESLSHAGRIAQLGSWEWSTDRDQFVWSDEALDVLKTDAEAIYNLDHLCSIIHREDREDLYNKITSFRSEHKYIECKCRRIFEDGKISMLAIHARQMSGTGQSRSMVVGAVQDITDQWQSECDLEAAKKEAEASSQAKSDFLANMSHEIRTPMNAILGMSYLALKSGLNEKQRGYVSSIKSAGDTLLRLINDILDFSKVEAGKLDLETIPFELDDVLDNLSILIASKAHEKGIEVVYSVPSSVPRQLVGDPGRLGQILLNLCSNAVKFTEEGEIVVSVGIDSSDSGKVILLFSVRDTGIGLTQSQREHLFDSFTQADTSTTRKYGGTGLGLSISRSLVHLMQGEIDVRSEPGVGSTFFFTAHFGVNKEERRRYHLPDKKLKNLRVLVVDDNESARLFVQDMLSQYSFRVDTAGTGEDGFEKIKSAAVDDPYRLVVMDWKLPDSNGIEISRQIKDYFKNKTPPAIILLTAYGGEEVKEQAEEISLDGFLLKPVSASVLFGAVLRALGQHESLNAHSADEQEDFSPNLDGVRLLLVDDNEINLDVAEEILAAAGIKVSVAMDGHEAVEKVRSAPFDVVLMDIQMPVMNGYDATKKIRSDNKNANLPIIAMTANVLPEDRKRCIDSGMNDFVSKPFDPKDLVEKIDRWVQKNNSQNQKESENSGIKALENAGQ